MKFRFMLCLLCMVFISQAKKTTLVNLSYDHLGPFHKLSLETPIGQAHGGLFLVGATDYTPAIAQGGVDFRVGTKDCSFGCDADILAVLSMKRFNFGYRGDCDFTCGDFTYQWWMDFDLLIKEDQFSFNYKEGIKLGTKADYVKVSWDAGILIRESPWGYPVARAEAGTQFVLCESGYQHPGWVRIGVNTKEGWVEGVCAAHLIKLVTGEKITRNYRYRKTWKWEDIEGAKL